MSSAHPQRLPLLVRVIRAVLLALGILAIPLTGLAVFTRGPILLSHPEILSTQPVSEDRLREAVKHLSVDLSPRWYTDIENLNRAAAWIGGEFQGAGLQVEMQEFSDGDLTYRNVIGRREGLDPDAGVVIIGAHYDAYGETPGADDNASGVAVLLELVRTLHPTPPRRTQVFVGFAVEEPPFFSSDNMGSAHFARRLLDEKVDVAMMVALDLVGYFSDEPNSQHFPLMGLSWIYPNQGNFIAVIGDTRSGQWIKQVKRGFVSSGELPVVSFRAPAFLPGVHWSDHLSFRRLGMPGVLVSDTAFMRNPNYHRPTDTLETLDYQRMAGVVRGLHGVLREADNR